MSVNSFTTHSDIMSDIDYLSSICIPESKTEPCPPHRVFSSQRIYTFRNLPWDVGCSKWERRQN